MGSNYQLVGSACLDQGGLASPDQQWIMPQICRLFLAKHSMHLLFHNDQMLGHSCYQRAFRCVEYRPKIHYVNFDLANLFYGKCCSSKTISARRSADGYKSPQCDALRFIFCRRRRLFVAFSEREPFLRGFLRGSSGSVLPKSCIWMSRTCAKSFVSIRPSVWICAAATFWRILQTVLVEWCYRIYSIAIWPYLHYMTC